MIGMKGYVYGNNEKIICPYDEETGALKIDRRVFENILRKIPTEQDRPTGHWINNQNGTYACDKCGMKHSRSNYCANCGSKME